MTALTIKKQESSVIVKISAYLSLKASLGDTCLADSDCSDLENSECIRMFDCLTGSCTCKSGYGNETGTGCNSMKSHLLLYCIPFNQHIKLIISD